MKNGTNELCIRAYVYGKEWGLLMSLVVIGLMFFSGHLHAEDVGVDYLAKIKPGVQKTFGKGSTFEWLAYIGEAGVCIWRYLSTQNIVWFFGMPVVMLFTYAFLG